jgi:hypothetical protein
LSASSSGDSSFLLWLEDGLLLQFYQITRSAKCKSMSIEVWQEWRCNAHHDQQGHETPMLTPKQKIHIGATCWSGNK